MGSSSISCSWIRSTHNNTQSSSISCSWIRSTHNNTQSSSISCSWIRSTHNNTQSSSISCSWIRSTHNNNTVHCRNGQISGLEEYRGAFQEERTKFCHSMRKQKDKVKRLEELLSYRDSGLHKENKRLVDTIVEREAEISRLKENVQDAERHHQRQQEDTVTWYETQKQKLSDQHNEAHLVTLNLLQRREEQLLQCEDKFTKSLAEHTLTWESERQAMVMKLKEVEKKRNYRASRNKTLETEFLQMEAQWKRQEEKLSKDLAQNQESWETDVKQLEEQVREQEEKLSKDLAQNQESWETDVKQLEEQVREQEEKLSKDLAQNQESWETELHLVETKLKEVTQEKDDLDPEAPEHGDQASPDGDTTGTGGGAEGRPGSEETEHGDQASPDGDTTGTGGGAEGRPGSEETEHGDQASPDGDTTGTGGGAEGRPGSEETEHGDQASPDGDTTGTGGGAEGRPGSEDTELGND
ncbi:hypothetical protein CgunFtcFv8_012231 [Champsocephalus gunnari]|uniref:Uncharacterized protein n=1 Tax=Champsocephalus gunnari TaxID=52237 RepID=A0AAN8HJ70_CHAGU|nr:hypothetical protein CgunFtcFv8_012231 [Champsocephalus gunnari]